MTISPEEAGIGDEPDMTISLDEAATQAPAQPYDSLFTRGHDAPPSGFDEYVNELAQGADLDPAPPRPAREQVAPVTAAPAKHQADEDLPIGAKPPRPWELALRGGTRALSGLALGLAAPPGYAGRELGENTRTINSLGDQYFAAQTDYANKVAALKRKREEQRAAQARADEQQTYTRGRDAKADERAARADARAQNADTRAATAADPDSAPNKRKRELEGEGADAQLERAKKLAQYRNSLPYKGPAILNAPYAGVTDETVTADSLNSALAEQFGGEDKIPPAFKERSRLVGAIKNPRKRAEAADRLLKDSQGQTNTGRTQERLEGATARRAGLDETKAYLKATEGLDQVEASLDQLDSVLKANGIDAERYKGEDIPGRGQVESLVPDLLAGKSGRQVRQADLQVLARQVYEASGKAITDQERQTFERIFAHQGGWGEQEYIDAFRFLRGLTKHRLERARKAYPGAAQDVDAEQAPSGPPAPAVQGKITTRYRNPKTGETGTLHADTQAELDEFLTANKLERR